MSDKSIVVDAFQRSRTELIIGSVEPYEGEMLAHLRTAIPDAGQEGEWVRTRKGIAVDIAEFYRILEALRKLNSVAATKAIGGRVQRNKNMEIRVYLEPFRGDVYCHVRTIYLRDDKPGKGVSVKAELLPSLIDLAEKIQKAIEARTWEEAE